ncbi:unnamed protein product [Allacma fusca]|uniref:Apolipoprotein D n=1 Tax=Allacma fusca TaxID=39272 RepID=A0A8J2LD08_9HEXA|nr:unnamed protein product [Allacma fusca]
MALIHLVILAIAICGTSAQIQFPGSCPNQTVVDPFNATAYLGKWYEIEAYFQVFSSGAMCTVAQYSLRSDGLVQVFNTNINEATGNLVSITGSARLTEGTAAKLAVSFPVAPGEAPYWVLETDYTNYSVVFACRDYGTVHFITTWYLSRSRNPSQQARDDVRSIFLNRGIDVTKLQTTNQTGCPPDTNPPPTHLF